MTSNAFSFHFLLEKDLKICGFYHTFITQTLHVSHHPGSLAPAPGTVMIISLFFFFFSTVYLPIMLFKVKSNCEEGARIIILSRKHDLLISGYSHRFIQLSEWFCLQLSSYTKASPDLDCARKRWHCRKWWDKKQQGQTLSWESQLPFTKSLNYTSTHFVLLVS